MSRCRRAIWWGWRRSRATSSDDGAASRGGAGEQHPVDGEDAGLEARFFDATWSAQLHAELDTIDQLAPSDALRPLQARAHMLRAALAFLDEVRVPL